jgi:hypothetical protein
LGAVSDRIRRRISAAAASLGIFVAALPVLAAEPQHAPHVHGLALMNVAVDGTVVEIELEMPGADIVGFERAPSTAAEKAAVAAATGKLRAGQTLFRFPEAAKCRMEHAEAEAPEDPEDADRGQVHTEFEAQYRFSCAVPDALSWIETGLFKAFPALREIEVQALSPRGQTAAELTPDKPRLEL